MVSKIVVKSQSRVVFDGKHAPPDTKSVTQIGRMLAALCAGLTEDEEQAVKPLTFLSFLLVFVLFFVSLLLLCVSGFKFL